MASTTDISFDQKKKVVYWYVSRVERKNPATHPYLVDAFMKLPYQLLAKELVVLDWQKMETYDTLVMKYQLTKKTIRCMVKNISR